MPSGDEQIRSQARQDQWAAWHHRRRVCENERLRMGWLGFGWVDAWPPPIGKSNVARPRPRAWSKLVVGNSYTRVG